MFFFSGYPSLLSGALHDLTNVPALHQKDAYFADSGAMPWNTPTRVKRYGIALPFYPFRTLSPRELHLRKQLSSEFDVASPLFPANTQLNFTFTRRLDNILNFLLPQNLDVHFGCAKETLTEAERLTATRFRVAADVAGGVATQYTINSATLVLKDVYMQVNMCT